MKMFKLDVDVNFNATHCKRIGEIHDYFHRLPKYSISELLDLTLIEIQSSAFLGINHHLFFCNDRNRPLLKQLKLELRKRGFTVVPDQKLDKRTPLTLIIKWKTR